MPTRMTHLRYHAKLFQHSPLGAPQSYNYQILAAAMERYTELEGTARPEIKDESALNLPILALPKKAER